MQVVDPHGRVIEARNVNANTLIKFGERYRAGNLFRKDHAGKRP